LVHELARHADRGREEQLDGVARAAGGELVVVVGWGPAGLVVQVVGRLPHG
jgi:hypothetical protein